MATNLHPTPSTPATPFLKWAGGKTRLLAQYGEHFPEDYNHYHEPFVGGGAVFFHLDPVEATLSDLNPRLIEAYRAIRDDVDELIARLHVHKRRHSKDYYSQSRTRFNAAAGTDAIDRAALLIYLNKTCFNGLYRENQRGEFNVPIGSYKSPTVFSEDHLRAVSERLQSVSLEIGSFAGVLDRASEGDLVYFDPPYVPLNQTSSFTSYCKGPFGDDLQVSLAQAFAELANRGCYVMLSNSDCDAVRELYRGWRVESVLAPRSINSRGGKRGAVGEVLVRSW